MESFTDCCAIHPNPGVLPSSNGFWDFSTFAVTHGTPGPLAPLAGTFEVLSIVLAFVAVPFVIRGANERIPALGSSTTI